MGDVVICKKPSDPGKHICKRVTAVAGDMVDLDPLTQPDKWTTRRPIIVPAGHVWLRGDNADHSMDPGIAVPVGLLQGKVTLRIFPGFSGSEAWKIDKDSFDRGRKIK